MKSARFALIMIVLIELAVSAFGTMNWIEVPDGFTTDAALSATPFYPVVGTDSLCLFAKSIGDGRIYFNSMDEAGTWSGWTEVPGGGTTDAALASETYGRELYLFGKGIDDKRIYVNVRNDQSDWRDYWEEVPGGKTTDVPLAAITYNNQLYLFAKGLEDNRIYFNIRDMAGVWKGWQEVPGEGTTNAALAATAFDDKLYLFGKGIDDNGIYFNTLDGFGNWQGWQAVQGAGVTDTALSATTSMGYKNLLWLFSKGIEDKGIYLNTLDEEKDWSGAVPGEGTTDVALASAVFGGNVYLFGKGINDMAVYYTIVK
jgi:hypothetical protein